MSTDKDKEKQDEQAHADPAADAEAAETARNEPAEGDRPTPPTHPGATTQGPV